MLAKLKKFVPHRLVGLYHWSLAVLATQWYGRPSEKLVVIGVTGTSGKSTVVEMIQAILEAAGFTVGVTSTIKFKIGAREQWNSTKMTMVGRFQLQKLLKEMVAAKCQYAIIETSSQGIEQSRHIGVHYDMAVLTNLYPEHLDAHRGFENYKQAKLKLFKKLEHERPKIINGKRLSKSIVVNLDCPHAPEFLGYSVDQKIGVTTASTYDITGVRELRAKLFQEGSHGGFAIGDEKFPLALPGTHNAANALIAYGMADALGIRTEAIARGLASVREIPGRTEFIRLNQPFTVIVDYAFEPKAMEKLYQVVAALPHKKVIQVLGTTGGGRDRDRGTVLGEMAGRFADLVIVTNEDPYDDNPAELIERVVQGALRVGKVLEKNIFVNPERGDAIRQAVAMAGNADVVLITGKGSEQAMVISGGKKIPWDDRVTAREAIAANTLGKKSG